MIQILCVDDQEANLTALEAVLQGPDRRLVMARSGREALEKISDGEYAVILMDVQMPILDGFQTARLIRQNPRTSSTPIVFLTANHPEERFVTQGYEAGAVDYLFKPLNPDILRAKVNVFVEFHRLRQLEKQASDRKYEALVEGIRDGFVWTAHPESRRITYISRRAESITGIARERWMTDPGPWDLGEHFEKVRREGAAVSFEHRLVRPDGRVVWLRTEMHMGETLPRFEPEIQALSVDVTRLKQTEEALREAIRVRDDFIAIASHELRTPITPLQLQLQGFLHMLDKGQLDKVPEPRLKAMLEISDSQVTRLGRLVSHLLDITRITSGQMSLEPEVVELDQLVHVVLDQLRHELDSSDCRVTLKLDPAIRGRWDRLRVEQVLVNLLTNAMKYAAGKPIEIITRAEGEHAVMVVKDHGMGVAMVDHSRIFQRFERAVSSKNFGGLGLGLYISKQIVELHQGSIELESEEGRGATFTVRLPRLR